MNAEGAAAALRDTHPVESLYKDLAPLFESKWKGAQCYIVSLSENGDQLSQWRAYAAQNGYCLGFSTAALKEALPEDALLRRVSYLDDGDDTKGLVEQSASMILSLRKALNERREVNPDDEQIHDAVTNEMISTAGALFKPEAFYEEEEVRVVHPEARASRFTPGDMGMVPRLSIPIPAEALVSIRVGPGAHQEQRARSLIDYMYEVNFGNAEARAAKPPTIISSPISLRSY